MTVLIVKNHIPQLLFDVLCFRIFILRVHGRAAGLFPGASGLLAHHQVSQEGVTLVIVARHHPCFSLLGHLGFGLENGLTGLLVFLSGKVRLAGQASLIFEVIFVRDLAFFFFEGLNLP